MQFINTPDFKEGTHALAEKIISFLNKRSKVLWLISGGSNIPITAAVLNMIRTTVSADILKNLTIAQADERYGPVGHSDSNWKQLEDAGVDFKGITTISILDNLSFIEAVLRYEKIIEKVFKTSDIIVGQFGMGADGHIAGILPHTLAVTEEISLVTGYESKPFTRVSLTFPALRKIQVAYMFVSGSAKTAAIEKLHMNDVSLADQPAQILKEIPEVYVYSELTAS